MRRVTELLQLLAQRECQAFRDPIQISGNIGANAQLPTKRIGAAFYYLFEGPRKGSSVSGAKQHPRSEEAVGHCVPRSIPEVIGRLDAFLGSMLVLPGFVGWDQYFVVELR